MQALRKHWSDVCPVFPQRLHFDLFLELFLPPLPLLLQSPLEGSLYWSLLARAAPILDAKECIFTTFSVIYSNDLNMTKRKKITLQVYSLCQGDLQSQLQVLKMIQWQRKYYNQQSTIISALQNFMQSTWWAVSAILFHVECDHNFSLQVDVCSNIVKKA